MNPLVPWTVRGYQPGDEKQLVQLFAQTFGRELTEVQYLWKLKGQPSPVENVWLAVVGERPVFQYAGVPTRVQLPWGEVTAMVSVDTMTAPDFRRRGLLTEVGVHTYEAWRQAGVAFVFGLPNEQTWGSRLHLLGHEPAFSMRWRVRPLRPEALLARRLKRPSLARLTPLGAAWNALFWRPRACRVERVLNAGADFDQLWAEGRKDGRWGVVRDAAWVRWRYLESSYRAYRVLLAHRAGRPLGYAAYCVDGSRGLLADVYVPGDRPEARRALIQAVAEELLAQGADSMAALAVPGSPFDQQLIRLGFLQGRVQFRFHLSPLDPRVKGLDWKNPDRWCFAGGDTDVV